MKRYPWVKYLKRSGPDLPYDSPIYLGNWSNGEFFHEQTPHERKVREEILKTGVRVVIHEGMSEAYVLSVAAAIKKVATYYTA